MKYSNDFSHDLEVGQLGERALGAILSGKKLEVKTDLQAAQTGNVFVEYESRGKPSGLAKTEADFWVFILSKCRVAIIETNQLRMICRPYYRSLRDINGGDVNSSRGILLPVRELIEEKGDI